MYASSVCIALEEDPATMIQLLHVKKQDSFWEYINMSSLVDTEDKRQAMAKSIATHWMDKTLDTSRWTVKNCIDMYTMFILIIQTIEQEGWSDFKFDVPMLSTPPLTWDLNYFTAQCHVPFRKPLEYEFRRYPGTFMYSCTSSAY